MDVNGDLTTLYTFGGRLDGASPSGTLVRNEAGDISGMTFGGGTLGYGTVFKLDRSRRESVLQNFQAGLGGESVYPQQGWIADRDGVTLPGGAAEMTMAATFFTQDPGRALLTGKCADAGAILMQQFRGLTARAPYFANGWAGDLTELVDFYDRRFRIGLTHKPQNGDTSR